MRRTSILFLMLFFSMCLVFAVTTSQSESLVINGFYNPASRDLILSVSDYNGTMLYYSDAVVTGEHIGSSGEIVRWSLYGEVTAGYCLTFTFSDFQAGASLTGPYYRPAYRITQNLASGGRLSYDSASSSEVNYGAKSQSNTAFAGSCLYRYNVMSSGTTTDSGSFNLEITDYETGAGDLTYHCGVTVTYTGP